MSGSKLPDDPADALRELGQQFKATQRELKKRAASDPRFQRCPPTYNVRCAEWAKKDYWTREEAANLLCYAEPHRPHPIEGQDALDTEIHKMRELLALSDVPTEGRVRRRYLAKGVITWAKEKGFEVPPELLQAMGEKVPRKDKSEHGNAVSNAQKREKVLGAALVAVIKYSAQCKGHGEKYTGLSIARVLEQRAYNLFEDKVAPFTVDTMARLINKFLSIDPLAEGEST